MTEETFMSILWLLLGFGLGVQIGLLI